MKTNQEQRAREVTQADREAAARMVVSPYVRDQIIAGKMDDHGYVQAFARHREAFATPAHAGEGEVERDIPAMAAAITPIVRMAINRAISAQVDPVWSFRIEHRLAEKDLAASDAAIKIVATLTTPDSVNGAASANDLLDWLQREAKDSRTGISFDWVPACEGEPSGYRFMRHHHIGEPSKSIAAAIKQNGGPS